MYYRNSRIASWRANEQSIVPPLPKTLSMVEKFRAAKQGQPEGVGGAVARKHRYRKTKKHIGKERESAFHFSLPSKFHVSVRAEAFNQLGGAKWNLVVAFKRALEGLKRRREGGDGSFANVRWREVVPQVHGWRRALAARIFDGLPLAGFVEFHAI